MQISVEPFGSWLSIIAIAFAMLLTIGLTYPAQVRHLSRRWRWGLPVLRGLACLVLLIFLLRPSLQRDETIPVRASWVFLLDQSRSMQVVDETDGRSRREAVVQAFAQQQPVLNELSKIADIHFYDMAEGLVPVQQISNQANGNFTAIGHAFDLLRQEVTGAIPDGVVLLSDGMQRGPSLENSDPLQAAQRLASETGAFVETFTLGTSEELSSQTDLEIESLWIEQPSLRENELAIAHVRVRGLGASGEKSRVRLLLENRDGKQPGEQGELIEISAEGEVIPFRDLEFREADQRFSEKLTFRIEAEGEYRLVAEIVPLQGEEQLLNNRLETLISVVKGKIRVAYFDVPRVEQRFFRRFHSSSGIQVDAFVFPHFMQSSESFLSPEIFAADAYDVFVIGDVPASRFQQGGHDWLTDLATRVRQGAGLLMTGGVNNFSAGGYGASPLANLLPVRMSGSGRGMAGADQLQKPIELRPTPSAASQNLLMMTDSSVSELPLLSGANRLIPGSRSVEIYAESAEGDPLILALNLGTSRTMAVAVDETWKWVMQGYSDQHHQFWGQLLTWLAKRQPGSGANLWVETARRSSLPYETVPVSVGFRSTGSQSVEDLQYQMEVLLPDGSTESLDFTQAERDLSGEFSNTTLPGEYQVSVKAVSGGQVVEEAYTRFLVQDRDLEMHQAVANPEIMQKIAAVTGGQSHRIEDFESFLTTLLEFEKVSDEVSAGEVAVWSGWPLFLLFVFLLSLEWTLRKVKGLV